ncbi:hypothetical protein Tco_0732067 [Tanacetum coccineum]
MLENFIIVDMAAQRKMLEARESRPHANNPSNGRKQVQVVNGLVHLDKGISASKKLSFEEFKKHVLWDLEAGTSVRVTWDAKASGRYADFLRDIRELDAEFIEYKAKAKASMDALEKKIDNGIRKLDVSIKAMKEESDAKLELLNSNAESSTTIGKNMRHKSWDVEGSNKLDLRKTTDMIRERFKPSTDSSVVFIEGMQPTGFERECKMDPQAAVDREMQHVMGTNQTGERVYRGGLEQIKQETDSRIMDLSIK